MKYTELKWDLLCILRQSKILALFVTFTEQGVSDQKVKSPEFYFSKFYLPSNWLTLPSQENENI